VGARLPHDGLRSCEEAERLPREPLGAGGIGSTDAIAEA
jgi:hypothetical protein